MSFSNNTLLIVDIVEFCFQGLRHIARDVVFAFQKVFSYAGELLTKESSQIENILSGEDLSVGNF